MARQQSLTN